jgi:hypothetical protein
MNELSNTISIYRKINVGPHSKVESRRVIIETRVNSCAGKG